MQRDESTCGSNINVLCWKTQWVNGRVPEIKRKCRRPLKIKRKSQNIKGTTKCPQRVAKISKMITRSARVSDVMGSAKGSRQIV